MKEYVLVTGGAGYIGSFTVHILAECGYTPIVYDDLSNGHKRAIPKNITFIRGDVGDSEKINKLFKKYKISAIMHFAGSIIAEESITNPSLYFKNNLIKPINLLNCAIKHKIKNFIFSSSAAIYGLYDKPIKENFAKKPINPYGETKLLFEQILDTYNKVHNLNYVSLRYFNAAGAYFDGKRGEAHKKETHLIPKIFSAIFKNSKFKIYGKDYDTEDGTAIRDYIHVEDLVKAHILALEKLKKENKCNAYNLGTGKGVSIIEIIDAVEKMMDKKLKIVISKRRKGDIGFLIADPSKAMKELKWKPIYSDVDTIIKTAFLWHKNQLKFKL